MAKYPPGQIPCPHDCRRTDDHAHYTNYRSPERQPEVVINPLDAERAAFSRGARAGEKCERAVIVKWLRDYCEKYPGHHNYRVTRNIANDIERGEHLAGNDE